MGEHPCWDDAKASTVCSRRTGGRSGFRKTRSMPAWARSVTKLFGDGDLEGMYPGLHCAGQGGGLALCGPGDGESRPRASELAALADERDSVAAVLRRSQRRGSGGSAMFRSALESGVAVAVGLCATASSPQRVPGVLLLRTSSPGRTPHWISGREAMEGPQVGRSDRGSRQIRSARRRPPGCESRPSKECGRGWPSPRPRGSPGTLG